MRRRIGVYVCNSTTTRFSTLRSLKENESQSKCAAGAQNRFRINRSSGGDILLLRCRADVDFAPWARRLSLASLMRALLGNSLAPWARHVYTTLTHGRCLDIPGLAIVPGRGTCRSTGAWEMNCDLRAINMALLQSFATPKPGCIQKGRPQTYLSLAAGEPAGQFPFQCTQFRRFNQQQVTQRQHGGRLTHPSTLDAGIASESIIGHDSHGVHEFCRWRFSPIMRSAI